MEKKADFKTMKKSEVTGFIWDYYKWWIIGGILVLVLAGNLIHHFVTYKEPALEIALINSGDQEKEPDFSEFMDKYGYDKSKQKVSFQNTFTVDLKNSSSGNMYAFEALQTQIAAGGIDVIAADKDVYLYMAKQQDAGDLSDILPKELMKKYEKDIVYVTDPDTNKKYPGGITLQNNKWMEQYGYYPKGCVIGIVNGSKHTKTAEQMIAYILGEE